MASLDSLNSMVALIKERLDLFVQEFHFHFSNKSPEITSSAASKNELERLRLYRQELVRSFNEESIIKSYDSILPFIKGKLDTFRQELENARIVSFSNTVKLVEKELLLCARQSSGFVQDCSRYQVKSKSTGSEQDSTAPSTASQNSKDLQYEPPQKRRRLKQLIVDNTISISSDEFSVRAMDPDPQVANKDVEQRRESTAAEADVMDAKRVNAATLLSRHRPTARLGHALTGMFARGYFEDEMEAKRRRSLRSSALTEQETDVNKENISGAENIPVEEHIHLLPTEEAASAVAPAIVLPTEEAASAVAPAIVLPTEEAASAVAPAIVLPTEEAASAVAPAIVLPTEEAASAVAPAIVLPTEEAASAVAPAIVLPTEEAASAVAPAIVLPTEEAASAVAPAIVLPTEEAASAVAPAIVLPTEEAASAVAPAIVLPTEEAASAVAPAIVLPTEEAASAVAPAIVLPTEEAASAVAPAIVLPTEEAASAVAPAIVLPTEEAASAVAPAIVLPTEEAASAVAPAIVLPTEEAASAVAPAIVLPTEEAASAVAPAIVLPTEEAASAVAPAIVLPTDEIASSSAVQQLSSVLEEAGLVDARDKPPGAEPATVHTSPGNRPRATGSEGTETPLGSLDRTNVSLGDSDKTTDSKRFIDDEWGVKGTMLKILLCVVQRVPRITVEQLVARGPVRAGLHHRIMDRCFTSILRLRKHGFIKIIKDPETLAIQHIELGHRMKKYD